MVALTRSRFLKLINRAATLRERIESFHAKDSLDVQDKVPELQKVLSVWQEKIGPGDDAWTKCLAWSNLKESDIPCMLQTSPFSMASLPEWANEIERFIDFSTDQYGLVNALNFVTEEPFLEIWEICRSYARSRLLEQLRVAGSNISASLTEQAWNDLLGALTARLQVVGLPFLYREFDQARPTGLRSFAKLLTLSHVETLPATPVGDEYYKAFVQSILQNGFVGLFEIYPVIARIFGEIFSQWVETTEEFLFRLHGDSHDLARILGLDRKGMGQVLGFRIPLSDHHNCGRTVIAARYLDTEIIYKPKDIAIEGDFNHLLETLNPWLKNSFKTNAVLCREGYGWAECVKHEPCSDLAAVGRFYERFGAILALLHVLRATDCHYENVIANGEYPTLIDMETLMHPEVGWVDEIRKIVGVNSPNRLFFDSVLRVGILPSWQFNADQTVAYDVSSLGYTEIENLLASRTTWRWCGSDFMHPSSEIERIPRPDNVPTVGDQSFEATEFLDNLTVGFEQMYRILIHEREALLNQNSPLRKMKNRAVRFIFRPSQVYGMIQKGALKPDFMLDGVWYGLEFEILARVFLSCEEKPAIWPLFISEVLQSTQLDIPFFQTSNDSARLRLTPEVCLESYFERPGFEDAIKKLRSINEDDLKRQLLLIRGAFFARSGHISGKEVEPQKSSGRDLGQESTISFYDHALKIGGQLVSTALWEKGSTCNWYGISFIASSNRFQLKPLGYNLYEGSLGVALFFSALYSISKNEEHARIARAATFEIRELLCRSSSSITRRMGRELGIGAGTGLGSIAYGLVKIADLLKDESIAVDAVRACRVMREHINSDVKFDVLGGAAGGLLGVLAVFRARGCAEAFQIAMECGDHLLQLSGAFQAGYSDVWNFEGDRIPIGFSHGAAGIAFAASSLYACSNDERFKVLAQEAMAYVDSASQISLSNQGLSRSWCNGIGGLALARLKCSQMLGSDSPEKWHNYTLASLENLSGCDHNGPDHLCCGQFGLIEIQLYAAKLLSEKHIHESALERALAMTSRMASQKNFRLHPSIQENSYFPGFFQGASGIGYTLLQLHTAYKLPNILAFD